MWFGYRAVEKVDAMGQKVGELRKDFEHELQLADGATPAAFGAELASRSVRELCDCAMNARAEVREMFEEILADGGGDDDAFLSDVHSDSD
eukprot:SAG11_NODE_1544_length_4716_cov_3.012995_5_plen_91_part_00